MEEDNTLRKGHSARQISARRRRIAKTELRPSDIHFTQEFINNHFENGELIGEWLDNLINDSKKITDIRTIRVVLVHDKYFTPDNRRLWVLRNFQKLRETIEPMYITVDVWNNFETEDPWVFAAKHDGYTVNIYDNRSPGGIQHTYVETIDTRSYGEPLILKFEKTGIAMRNGVAYIGYFIWDWIIRPVVSRTWRSKTNCDDDDKEDGLVNVTVV